MWLRRSTPLPVKRFIGKWLMWVRLLYGMVRLARIRGLHPVLGTCADFLAQGRGIPRFAQWCRECIAYENRSNARSYGRWRSRYGSRRPTFSAAEAAEMVAAQVEQVDVPANGQGCIRGAILGCTKRYLLFVPESVVVDGTGVVNMIGLAEQEDAVVVYSDEDVFEDGHWHHPRFKPGFSIDLFRAVDYIGPFFLLRVDAAQAAVAGRTGLDAPLIPYELILLVHEAGGRVVRLAEMAVSWSKPRSLELDAAKRRAAAAHCQRLYGQSLGSGVASLDAGQTDALAERLVSIVIPTKDRIDLLGACIESIYRHSRIVDFEVIVLDNRSQEPASKAWFASAAERFERLRVVQADYPFNWSQLNNHGSALARGDLLLFLNNDVEALDDGWLDRLCLHALRPEAGAVGPLLVFPGGDIQHAGVVMGIGGFADHVYACCPVDEEAEHVFVSPLVPRNVLACTGACLMIEAEKLKAIGGFNEQLRICGDIELCLRLHHNGWLNVYEPRVKLVHHESATRSKAPLPLSEIEGVRPVAEVFLEEGDPYYNPNLSLRLRYPTLDW
jgi:O-antigen biosynthesis protein